MRVDNTNNTTKTLATILATKAMELTAFYGHAQ